MRVRKCEVVVGEGGEELGHAGENDEGDDELEEANGEGDEFDEGFVEEEGHC